MIDMSNVVIFDDVFDDVLVSVGEEVSVDREPAPCELLVTERFMFDHAEFIRTEFSDRLGEVEFHFDGDGVLWDSVDLLSCNFGDWSLRTFYSLDYPVSQRFVTIFIDFSPVTGRENWRKYTAGSFEKAVGHFRRHDRGVLDLVAAREELLASGGAVAVSEGVL